MNNMTGDPNQENRPSVFGFEPYPSRNFQPIDWSRIPIEQSAIPTIPLVPPGQFNSGINFPQAQVGLGNFSFCSTQTPHPAQFPFPTSTTIENNVLQAQATPSTSSMRCKRKTESPPLQLCKQHITEEKMAEHMSKLHISSETASTSKETDRDRTKRLYMCEEMRKLQSDTILPQTLLSSMQRPCTALVLWQPPRRLISPQPRRNNEIENENSNNNEEAVPDHNRAVVNDGFMENDNMDLDQV